MTKISSKERKVYFFLATIVSAFSAFFINYYLSQKLDVLLYGEFSLLFGFFALLSSVIIFGQTVSIGVVFFSDEKNGYKNIVKELNHSYKLMGYAYVSVGFLLYIYWYFFDTKYSFALFILFCIALLFATVKIFFTSLVTLFDEYKKYLLLTFIMGVLSIIIIILYPSLEGFLYGVVVSGIVAMFFGSKLHLMNKLESIGDKVFSKKELISLGWIAIPGMIISSLNAYLDRYIISYFYSLEEVAYYSLATTVSIGVGMVFINALIKGTIISTLQALQEKDVTKYLAIQNENMKIFLGLAIIAFMVYYAFGEWLVLSVFGEKYANSTPYILALFYYVLMNGVSQVLGQSLVQQKKLYILFYISVFTISLNLALSIALNYPFGIKGIIIALLVSGYLNNFIIFYYAKKNFEFIKFPYFSLTVIMSLSILSLV
jgi:O-antigen/teichoic acid export membrane protein